MKFAFSEQIEDRRLKIEESTNVASLRSPFFYLALINAWSKTG